MKWEEHSVYARHFLESQIPRQSNAGPEIKLWNRTETAGTEPTGVETQLSALPQEKKKKSSTNGSRTAGSTQVKANNSIGAST